MTIQAWIEADIFDILAEDDRGERNTSEVRLKRV